MKQYCMYILTFAISIFLFSSCRPNYDFCNIYDPESEQYCGCWLTKEPMPTDRTDFGIAEASGKIYVIGGEANGSITSSVIEYDPSTNKWQSKADMPTPRHGLSCAFVNNKIYALGGSDPLWNEYSFEVYDPETNTWEILPDMPFERRFFGCAVVGDKIYVIGGYGPGADVYEYDPVGETWTAKADMITYRVGLTCSVVSGKIYAIGGMHNYQDSNVVEEYDPTANSWKTCAVLNYGREHLCSVACNGKIYVFGGHTRRYLNDYDIRYVEEYNPGTDSWQIKTSIPIARSNLKGILVGEQVYVIGGYSMNYVGGDTNQEYSPLNDQ